DDYHNTAPNDNKSLEFCSGPRRFPTAVRRAVVLYLATDRHLLARVGTGNRHRISDRFTDARAHSCRRTTQLDGSCSGTHLVPGDNGRLPGITYVPVFGRPELYPTSLPHRYLPDLRGGMGCVRSARHFLVLD